MLGDNFFNLTKSESGSVDVRVTKDFQGICVDLTDSRGDELKIVLTPKTIQDLVQALFVYEDIKAGVAQVVPELAPVTSKAS